MTKTASAETIAELNTIADKLTSQHGDRTRAIRHAALIKNWQRMAEDDFGGLFTKDKQLVVAIYGDDGTFTDDVSHFTSMSKADLQAIEG